ncbi:hypothetical protein FG05_35192 [Fusarium graminearum]|nr:hypothetical protein FG05_35192 [Fusarium graminearum]
MISPVVRASCSDLYRNMGDDNHNFFISNHQPEKNDNK